ncbi:MAG: flagellar hook-associated protein FlgK, partial [Rhodocyclaceae bacterium]
MGTSILNIGVSGLNAAQAGLLTTGHNITNAATSGYNRQRIVQTTNTPQFSGAGYFGQGTNVSNVERVYSQFLNTQVNAASAQAAQYDTYSNEISQLDNLLADESAGVSPALQGFFDAVGEVSANPASIPARQAMLSGAESLAARFQSVDSRMSEIRDGVNGQISSTVSGINSIAQQVADLNQRIVVAQASAQGHPANDLLDQREQLISELNKQIRVTTTANDDGSVNVFVGNGQGLVVGMQASSFAAVASLEDKSRIEVALQGRDGTMIRLPESLITGGKLGGLIAFRSQTLEPAMNALGRIAAGFAQTFNAQHKLGQDLTGALGTDMFNLASPVVLGNTLNTGSAAIAASLGSVADLTGSDYRLAYDGTNYTLTRLSDNTSWTAGSLAALPPSSEPQGFSLTATSGTPAAGDTFLIQPTRQAAKEISLLISDTRNIAAAAPVRTSALTANMGTATISAGTLQSTSSLASAVPTTLAYDAATNTLSGFPATLPVTVTHNGTATTYAAGTTIPYVSGDT